MINKIRENAACFVAFFGAVLLLGVMPLYFHDAFFDINRAKVDLLLSCAPFFAGAFALGAFLHPRKNRLLCVEADCLPAFLGMGLFILACVVSCAMAGFESAVLTGSEGRYGGLWFVLACGAMFFVVALGRISGGIITVLAMCAATACAVLGIVNAMGIDPLGFYTYIRNGQEIIYFSTIGHYDFFGSYLSALAVLAAGIAVFSEKKAICVLATLCTLVMMLAAYCSRTDCVLLVLNGGVVVLLSMSGGGWGRIKRAFALWAACWGMLPVAHHLLIISEFHPPIEGVFALLGGSRISWIVAYVLLGCGVLCAVVEKRGKQPPGEKRTLVAVWAVVLIVGLLLIGCVLWFSAVDTQADLGALQGFLRFDDYWGSYRGYAYIRSLRSFAASDLPHKLFGQGMELTSRILAPYSSERPDIIATGIFNDAHCQPLQYLITCGLFGFASLITLHIGTLVMLATQMKNDPLLRALFTALLAYSIVMLLNVAQPILMMTYFALCALSVSRVRRLKEDKR